MHAFVYVRVGRLCKGVSKIFVQYSLPFFVLVFCFLCFLKTLVEIWLIMTYTNPRLRREPEVATFVATKRKQMHCIVIGHASLNHW